MRHFIEFVLTDFSFAAELGLCFFFLPSGQLGFSDSLALFPNLLSLNNELKSQT